MSESENFYTQTIVLLRTNCYYIYYPAVIKIFLCLTNFNNLSKTFLPKMALNNIVVTRSVRADDQNRLSPPPNHQHQQQPVKNLQQQQQQPKQRQSHPAQPLPQGQQTQGQQPQGRRASIPPMSPTARPGVRFTEGCREYGTLRTRSRFLLKVFFFFLTFIFKIIYCKIILNLTG